MCLSYEHAMLPGNLHYTDPNPNCSSLNSGILKVRFNACQLIPSPILGLLKPMSLAHVTSNLVLIELSDPILNM